MKKGLVLTSSTVSTLIFLFTLLLTISTLAVLATPIVVAWSDNGSLNQIVDDCNTLNTTNAVYTLNQSVVIDGTCFVVAANNITFDGGANRVVYGVVDPAVEGIKLKNYNFTTISNFIIEQNYSGSSHGITLDHTNNATISNITINSKDPGDIWLYGLYLSNSQNNTFTNISEYIDGLVSAGVFLTQNSKNNFFSNIDMNVFEQDSDGVSFDSNSGYNTLANISIQLSNGFNLHGLSIKQSPFNSFSNTSISVNGTISNGISMDTDSDNNQFTNLNVILDQSSYDGIYLHQSNNTYFENLTVNVIGGASAVDLYGLCSNTTFLNPTFTTTSGFAILDYTATNEINYLMFRNSFGEIKFTNIPFLRNLTTVNNITPQTVGISNDSAFLNSTYFSGERINSSANITLFGLQTNFIFPHIYRDATTLCDANSAPSCKNFTSLNSGTVIFNVSSWNNYSYSVLTQFDLSYPQFSNYQDNSQRLVGSGVATFNVTIANTNGTVLFEINGTNHSATNVVGNIYNASVFLTNATYSYTWYSFGNGTDSLFNSSPSQNYIINDTDIIAPTINFSVPTTTNATNISQGWFFVNITASDANLLSINISVYNSSQQLIWLQNGTASPLTLNFTVPYDGVYYFNATAIDTSNNSNFTATRTITLSPSPPMLLNYSTNYYTNQSVHVFTTINKISNATINVGPTLALGTIFVNSTNTTNHEFALTGLLNNTLYFYNVTFTDLYGNYATYGSYNFTTNDTPIVHLVVNYSDWDVNQTTNFSLYQTVQPLDIPNVTFSNANGEIYYLQNITVNQTLDLRSKISITPYFLFVNSTLIPEFNKSANITFRNVNLSHPIVKRDNLDCAGAICTNNSYNSTTQIYTFQVSGFSTYALVEQCTDGVQNYDETGVDCGGANCGACPATPSGSSGGGGSGSRSGGSGSGIIPATPLTNSTTTTNQTKNTPTIAENISKSNSTSPANKTANNSVKSGELFPQSNGSSFWSEVSNILNVLNPSNLSLSFLIWLGVWTIVCASIVGLGVFVVKKTKSPPTLKQVISSHDFTQDISYMPLMASKNDSLHTQLKDYLSRHIKAGHSPQTLAHMCFKSGWSHDVVEKTINELHTELNSRKK